jgi:hypothetical protein
MKNTNSVQVEDYKFGRVVRELMKLSGKDFRTVIRAEAAHILSGAMSSTKVGSIKKIVRNQMPIGMRYSRATGSKEFGKIGSSFYYLGGKQKDQNWSQLIDNRIKRTDKALENRGLTASQFYLMSQMLGLKLPRPPRNKAVSKGSHSKIKKFLNPHEKNLSKDEYQLILQSSSPMNANTGRTPSKFKSAGSVILAKTSGRAKLFSRAVRNEFLKDIKFRTKYYPLLFK